MTDTNQAREEIRQFGRRYDYDVNYLEELLDSSPEGFAAFTHVQAVAAYRKQLPLDAHYVAAVCTMQVEDCGACAQLNLRMAVEAGVSRELLATLIHEPDKLPADLADVRAHTLAVVRGEALDESRVARLTERYGREGFAELALCITGCRMYPTMKRALNRMTACAVPHLDF